MFALSTPSLMFYTTINDGVIVLFQFAIFNYISTLLIEIFQSYTIATMM